MTNSKLQKTITKGEGLRIEFKKAEKKLPSNLFETVCAFLNKSGGEIILRVNDNKKIEGIDKDKVVCKNANKPYQWGALIPGNFEPHPKNPHIAQIFTQMGRSEELGTGIQNVFKYNKIYSNVNNNDFIEDDVFITTIPLKIFNEKDGELNGELNKRQLLVLKAIRKNEGITAGKLSKQLNIPFSTIDKYMRIFLSKKLIERRGSKKTGGYYAK